jgi:hypothetical protein
MVGSERLQPEEGFHFAGHGSSPAGGRARPNGG